ncbi:MAG: hypothetical protein US49_C0007G0040 [candidate division TM6 bacterium GW2011_GWF2_37_49]|nr:MAG: hypothetical protein US49_C0007G0040 [candidate division TM6 bacterium GW2011_GWF2_37_49]
MLVVGASAASVPSIIQTASVYRINIEKLALYNVLLNAKKIISNNYLEIVEIGDGQDLREALSLINKEIALFTEIVDGFNKGKNPLIQLKFMALCNYFKNREAVEPRHLRIFENKVYKFDDCIQKYVAERRAVLSNDEIALCEKIFQFNEILVSCCLNYEYFDIDVFDRVVDWTVHRPVEAMKAHPYITAAVVITIVTIISIYLYKRSQRQSGDIGGTAISADAIVAQKSVEKQHAAWCAKHALMNLKAALDGKNGVLTEEQRTAAEEQWADQVAEMIKAENSEHVIESRRANLDYQRKQIVDAKAEIAALEAKYSQFPTRSFVDWLTGKESPDISRQRQECLDHVYEKRARVADLQSRLDRSERDIRYAAQLLACAQSPNPEIRKGVFNNIPGDYVERLLDIEAKKVSDQHWQNTYLISETTQLSRFRVKPEEVASQMALAKNYLESCKEVEDFEFDGAAKPDPFDSGVWTYFVRPLLRDRGKIVDGSITPQLIEDAILKMNLTIGGDASVRVRSADGEDVFLRNRVGLIDARQSLWENGTPIHFIVNLGRIGMGGVGAQGGFLHWIYYRAYKEGDKIKLAYADSFNDNHDNTWVTRALYDFFKTR